MMSVVGTTLIAVGDDARDGTSAWREHPGCGDLPEQPEPRTTHAPADLLTHPIRSCQAPTRLSLVDSVNTKIRLLTRIAFGFRLETVLISLALLSLGGYCPSLPGRP
jgi:hypothetical protein